MIPSTATYYLRDGALSATPAVTPTGSAATLPAGGTSLSFDLPVGTPTVLSGTPSAVLYLEVLKAKGAGGGQGRITVTLEDCVVAAGPCTVLSAGSQSVGGHGAGTQPETVTLDATTAVVPPGHVLRLGIALATQGNAEQAVLSYGGTSVPSRVDLTAAPPP